MTQDSPLPRHQETQCEEETICLSGEGIFCTRIGHLKVVASSMADVLFTRLTTVLNGHLCTRLKSMNTSRELLHGPSFYDPEEVG